MDTFNLFGRKKQKVSHKLLATGVIKLNTAEAWFAIAIVRIVFGMSVELPLSIVSKL